MITRIIYNCDPESLADISQEAFVDAFENQLAATPHFREASAQVTFAAGKSGLTHVSGTSLPDDPVDEYDALVRLVAERAFHYCCSQAAD